MKNRFLLAVILACALPLSNSQAQEACDTAALETCKAACFTAQPACSASPLLTIEEIRAVIAEKCGCSITTSEEGTTCTCTDTARNYGKYRSCVAQLSESLKSFKLSSAEAREQLKSDNALCKSAISDNRGKGKKEKKEKEDKD